MFEAFERFFKFQAIREALEYKIKILGEATVKLASAANRKPISVKACAVDGSSCRLLSYSDFLSLGGQPLSLPDEFNVTVSELHTEKNIGVAKIQLRADATPIVQGARKLAFRLHESVGEELDRLESQNIIKRVRGPTDWLSPIVVAYRKNGAPRICGDFRKLNQHIQRERFIIPTPDSLFSKLHGSTVFSKLDLESGFNQVKLDEKSSRLVTIATHKGNYRYLRLPFGICSAPEIFQRVMADHLADLEGCLVFIDDILVHGKDINEHNERLRKVLQRLEEIEAKLNKKKSEIGKSKIKFLGHTISQHGVSPDEEKIAAALCLSPPKNVEEARRYLGTINYLQRFLPDLSTIDKGIREMLSGNFDEKAISDSWHSIQMALKAAACKSFSFYDPKLPIAIQGDASPHGLGAVLLQLQNEEWKPVMTASRSLTKTEKRYSQMEREMLSLVFGAERFRQFVQGGIVDFWSDHKPLEKIWDKPFDDVPPRLQRMLLRLASYGAKIIYHAAKEQSNRLPDTLSRTPTDDNTTEISNREYEQIASLIVGPDCLGSDFLTLEDVSNATVESNALSSIIRAIESNDWSKLPESLDPYFKERHLFSVHKTPRLLLKGTKIVMPLSLREQLIILAHDSHL